MIRLHVWGDLQTPMTNQTAQCSHTWPTVSLRVRFQLFLHPQTCFLTCAQTHMQVERSADICRFHNRTKRSRRALPITETELMLMAAAAIIGLSRSPNTG